MSTLLNAKVKYPSREIDTKYGRKINVVLITDTKEEIKLWRDPGDPELTSLRKNQNISLLKNDKNKYSIVKNNNQDTKNTIDMHNWSKETQELLKNTSKQYIEFYKDCDNNVRANLTNYINEESIRAISTTIFLQSLKQVCL